MIDSRACERVLNIVERPRRLRKSNGIRRAIDYGAFVPHGRHAQDRTLVEPVEDNKVCGERVSGNAEGGACTSPCPAAPFSHLDPRATPAYVELQCFRRRPSNDIDVCARIDERLECG